MPEIVVDGPEYKSYDSVSIDDVNYAKQVTWKVVGHAVVGVLGDGVRVIDDVPRCCSAASHCRSRHTWDRNEVSRGR
jgi:hypothetical protein